MTSNWITPQLKDLDQTFDPYFIGTKPQYTGIVGVNGVDARDRFAPLVFGQMAPATSLIASNGSGGFGSQDLNQLFAALGTAAYLQSLSIPSPFPPSYFQYCPGVTLTDRLTARIGVVFKATGTWELWLYSTNYKTDYAGLYSTGTVNRNQTNYTNGALLSAGSWTYYNPNPSPYIVFANSSGFQSGTKNDNVLGDGSGYILYPNYYANINPNNSSAADGYHNALYRSDANYSAIADGRWYSLSSDVTFMLLMDAQGGSNSSNFFDVNSALSWYNKCNLSFTIAKPGGQQISTTITVGNEIRWNPTAWPNAQGSIAGGGGAGCVAVSSWLNSEYQAGYVQAGDLLYCMTDSGEFKELPVKYAFRKVQPCVIITMEGGADLTVSTSTPITLRNGSKVMVTDLIPGIELPTRYKRDNGISKWEAVKSIQDTVEQEVMLINVGGNCYAAGDSPDALIYTHNKSEAE